MKNQKFSDLDLHPAIQTAVRDEGYTQPTPIQAQAIPHLLTGRDLLGVAQTGTGKTAAFALPILQRLTCARRPSKGRARVLVLTPTRELAIQIDESFGTYGKGLKNSHTVIFGGVGQRPQVKIMERGVDVLVATPGRLLDLMGQGHIHLDEVGIFVLDEADRMLDMGFIHDVRRVIQALPSERQTLLFSATMPEAIAQLARTILRDPVRVEVTPESTTVELITQHVMFVEKRDKIRLLSEVLGESEVERALVFTRTKHGANKVVKLLGRVDIEAEAIHGNKSQSARQRALGNFKAGRTDVLVATDIAARGIDVEGISHVINYDLPNIPESYVHRIGRTARAGADGIAISFCDVEERTYLRDIERLIRQRVDIVSPHAYESEVPHEPAPSHNRPSSRNRPSSHRRRRMRRPTQLHS
jgi:ATP-dependent RNA helicase RhlE